MQPLLRTSQPWANWQARAVLLAIFTPPIVTVYLAFSALNMHGWRADVIAAMCLVALHALCVSMWLVTRSRCSWWSGIRNTEIKESPQLDLLFESNTVTASEAVRQLANFIEGA